MPLDMHDFFNGLDPVEGMSAFSFLHCGLSALLEYVPQYMIQECVYGPEGQAKILEVSRRCRVPGYQIVKIGGLDGTSVISFEGFAHTGDSTQYRAFNLGQVLSTMRPKQAALAWVCFLGASIKVAEWISHSENCQYSFYSEAYLQHNKDAVGSVLGAEGMDAARRYARDANPAEGTGIQFETIVRQVNAEINGLNTRSYISRGFWAYEFSDQSFDWLAGIAGMQPPSNDEMFRSDFIARYILA